MHIPDGVGLLQIGIVRTISNIWVLVYFSFLLCFIAWQNYAVLLQVQMYIIFVSSTVMLVVRCFQSIHAQIILLSGSPCTNNPCENGGTCSVVDGFASCACLNNWSGQTCTGNCWTWYSETCVNRQPLGPCFTTCIDSGPVYTVFIIWPTYKWFFFAWAKFRDFLPNWWNFFSGT